jgi:solute carrier family 25 carnitine/acylcarnitine transporter 20/29
MGLYFTSFNFIKRYMSHDPEGTWREKMKIMFAGGAAGLMSWIIGYPIDFLKTKFQSQDLDDRKYKGMKDCFERVYRKYGKKVFTRGLLTVCLRSVPVNAVSFLVEDEIGVLLDKK